MTGSSVALSSMIAGEVQMSTVLISGSAITCVDAETLTAKMIDNSVVDQLLQKKFIQRRFGKEVR